MYCVEGKGEVVPNSIFVCQCKSYRQEWSGGSRRGHFSVTARTGQTVSTGASSEHFSDPKSGGGKQDKGGLCSAEQRKIKNCGICGKNLQS